MFVVSLCFAWQQSCAVIGRPGTAKKDKMPPQCLAKPSMYSAQLRLSVISWIIDEKIEQYGHNNSRLSTASAATATSKL